MPEQLLSLVRFAPDETTAPLGDNPVVIERLCILLDHSLHFIRIIFHLSLQASPFAYGDILRSNTWQL